MKTSLLVTIVTVICATATPTAAIPGGWNPIADINDPHVQELGGWAVAEHVKKANDGLKFSKVVSGQEQVVSGMNYRLAIDALRMDGEVARYQAVVYEQEWTNTRKLLSFDPAAN